MRAAGPVLAGALRHHMRTKSYVRVLSALFVFLVLDPSPLGARVVSYAPVTSQAAIPAHQRRTNRFFVLWEGDLSGFTAGGGPAGGMPGPWGLSPGRLVVYDSKGEVEPCVVLPATGPAVGFAGVAAFEGHDGVLRILAVTSAGLNGDNPQASTRLLYSNDGGATWKAVPVPSPYLPSNLGMQGYTEDFGGPFCQGRTTSVRAGNDEIPFVVFLQAANYNGDGMIAGIRPDGSLVPLALAAGFASGVRQGGASFSGSNAEGTSFLVTGAVSSPLSASAVAPTDGLYKVGTNGSVTRLLAFSAPVSGRSTRPSGLEGWLTPDGSAYVEVDWYGAPPVPPLDSSRALFLVRDGAAKLVAASLVGGTDVTTVRRSLFAIPTSDYAGAWVIQRGPGLSTILSRHTPGGLLAESWRDVTAPEVEALHAGASGQKLLVQVNRPRPQPDQRLFRDPALATWEVGQPAPRFYDELFLNEQYNKGFVHLDVDAVAAGEPFVFDSGVPALTTLGGGPSGGAGGGADVIQEWGVVKGSLKQRLVVPAVARTSGMMGSFWRTDLVLHNPDPEPLTVRLRFVPSSGPGGTPMGLPGEAPVSLAASEIRVLEDVLGSTFGQESASGALFLTAEGMRSLEATSRTYTTTALGTYGVGVGAVDIFAASSPRFPVTFSGALLGADFRTNAGAVDTSGRGAEVSLRFAGGDGWAGMDDFSFLAPAGGHAQINGLAFTLGLDAWRTGAVTYRPLTGEVIPFLVAVDNRTNDPSYFPPDLPSPFVRVLPALVHVDGANGSHYRTDLFLYNTGERVETVTLLAKRWDTNDAETSVTLTLLPHEAKAIHDALQTAFGKTGVARLRFTSNSSPDGKSGVRVTSRAYTVDANGGTYGFVLPPLNAFQTAGPGEALEILGPVGGSRFRTNLALVDTTAFADGKNVRVRVEVLDQTGSKIDSFEVNVPVAGGMQIDDIFRTRGLGDGPPAALIRILPAGGLVGAYATTVDQGTNDPTYFAAGLAARE